MAEEPTPSAAPERVRVSRTFRASRHRVYRAWTDPELLMRWFIEPDSEMHVRKLDLRVGGRYLEVKPPEKLVYTWRWEEDPSLGGPGDTVVTVEFREKGNQTELTVTQEGFTSPLAKKEHDAGWIGCLDRLGAIVENGRNE